MATIILLPYFAVYEFDSFRKYNLSIFSGETIPRVEYTQEEIQTWYVWLNRYLSQDCSIKYAHIWFLQCYVSS